MKPLIKWPGGKSKLAPHIIDAANLSGTVPAYVEPFVGAGGMFCAFWNAGLVDKHTPIRLADKNPHVVKLLKALRDDPLTLSTKLRYLHRKYHHPSRDSERLYYEQRDLWNAGEHDPWRFVFLKQTSFNGLWRVNRKGELNASWGKYKTALIWDEENILEWNRALQGDEVQIQCDDFAGKLHFFDNAVIYVDPPYYQTFTGYTADGFDHFDHLRLLIQIWKWRSYGARVIYSNSVDVLPLVELLWPDGERHELSTTYSINTDGEGRVPVPELLVIGGKDGTG